jgi:hypothetical protein
MFVVGVSLRPGVRTPNGLRTALVVATGRRRPARRFEATGEDAGLGVLEDPVDVVDAVQDILRLGDWCVGIGVGPVDLSQPGAGSGRAFVLSRRAVERARSRRRPVPVAVEGLDVQRAQEAEAVLTLAGAVSMRRTPGGWAAIDAWRSEGPVATQEDVAGRLGVSQQAVSQRVAAALWHEEQAVRPVLARLLAEAAG